MIQHFVQNRVIVRGAGEMASGVIHSLVMAGFEVVALEKTAPTCVRRYVCYADALFKGKVTVEGVTAFPVSSIDDALAAAAGQSVPLLIDPEAEHLPALAPMAVVEARMLKREIDVDLDTAPIIIGLGPGFVAGKNCHAAVETNRGIDLGRVFYDGHPQSYTGVPAPVNGFADQRVVRSPASGVFTTYREITDVVKSNEVLGEVAGVSVVSSMDGMVRGLIHSGSNVSIGQKIGDLDPRCVAERCYSMSKKAQSVGEGALEALTSLKMKVAPQ
jgi:xanthine dehydrogenase accessory factor